jgi:hypothetical protein
MMRETIVAVLLVTLLCIFPFIGGIVSVEIKRDQELDKCAKEHNVYACEFIVVPVKEGE